MFRLKAEGVPLTEQEEKAVFEIYRNGTEEQRNKAQERILQANLKLVYKIAHEFMHSGLPFEDLVSEGCIGLLHAADKFDMEKGVRFITYAVWWIRQRMRKAIETQSRTVRVPAKANVVKARLLRSMTELTAALGHTPTTAELAQHLEEPEYRIRDILYSLGQAVSIDAEEEDREGNTQNLHDRSKELMTKDLSELVIDREMEAAFKAVWPKLSVRDQYILSMRYGLDGNKPATLEETAQEIGKCRERVRQLQTEALDSLKKLLKTPK